MKKTIKTIIAAALVAVVGMWGLAQPVDAAVDCSLYENASQEIKDAVGCGSGSETAFPEALKNIINFVIGVGGLVAVIYIVIGGIGYMTSNGDASKLAKAKNTILYALIGLVICALAFAIVNFAVGAINNATTPTEP